MNDKIRICALGGLDEEGKNLLVIEINDDIFVVEAGVMEPDKTMPGVDYVIPPLRLPRREQVARPRLFPAAWT